uniref:Uncharacterized protein n=1 Tax=Anguilla anguilla TaxID=7936 RepID=A0A0E9XYS2_ANGAN
MYLTSEGILTIVLCVFKYFGEISSAIFLFLAYGPNLFNHLVNSNQVICNKHIFK